MIEIDDHNITISRGDTLDILFKLYNFALNTTDTVVFTIKQSCLSKTPLMEKKITPDTTDSIHLVISADEMAQLGIGSKQYDLVVLTADNKRITLIYPARFTVAEVVHDICRQQ